MLRSFFGGGTIATILAFAPAPAFAQSADPSSASAPARPSDDETIRHLEQLVHDGVPAWAGMSISAWISTFDGSKLPMHWARMKGVEHFFHTLTELNNFLELAKVGLRPNEKLLVYDSPEREFSRESAHVIVAHLGHVEEIVQSLAALEKKGLRFADVRQILITHIHLDHSGSVGTILEKHPHIEVFVHGRGAPHCAAILA